MADAHIHGVVNPAVAQQIAHDGDGIVLVYVVHHGGKLKVELLLVAEVLELSDGFRKSVYPHKVLYLIGVSVMVLLHPQSYAVDGQGALLYGELIDVIGHF